MRRRPRLVGSATVPVGDLVRARDAEQLKYAVSAAQDRAARSRAWPAAAPLELRNDKAVEHVGYR